MCKLDKAAEAFASKMSNDELVRQYMQGAFKFGATWQEMQTWHDLRKNINDLPEKEGTNSSKWVLARINTTKPTRYEKVFYSYESGKWFDEYGKQVDGEVIVWADNPKI